jgi:cytidine deaminase
MSAIGRELELVGLAREVRDRAYAPYSRFHVGATLLGKSGKTYQGCNIENSAYPSCICAEHSAIAVAVSSGEKEFDAIAVAGPDHVHLSLCGKCRQVLAEFSPSMLVIVATQDGFRSYPLLTLLPDRFDGACLVRPEDKE